jgi:hypothetical protein
VFGSGDRDLQDRPTSLIHLTGITITEIFIFTTPSKIFRFNRQKKSLFLTYFMFCVECSSYINGWNTCQIIASNKNKTVDTRSVALMSCYLRACRDLHMDMFLVLYKPKMAAHFGVMLVSHFGDCWSVTRSDDWQVSLWFSLASRDKFRDIASIRPSPPPSISFLNRQSPLVFPLVYVRTPWTYRKNSVAEIFR